MVEATPVAFAAHFWDLLEAPKYSLSQVRARLRAGWTLAALPAEQSYCSAGGVGQYSCYLRGPTGELGQLTDKSLAQLGLTEQPPVIALDQTTVVLKVPFGEKDEAKSLGATWDGQSRAWRVRPAHTSRCAKWICPSDAPTR